MKPQSLFLTLATAGAADGIRLVQRTTTPSGVQTTETQIEATRMRTEITDASGAGQVVIFDAGKQVLYLINPAAKTYSEMTLADVERLGNQMQAAMAQMQAQMAAMPPAARAQMEAMMRGRGMAAMAPRARTEYQPNGTGTAGRWTCDRYDGFRDGQKVSELCTVSPSTLGFDEADFAVAGQLAAFFSKLMPEGAERIAAVERMEEQGFSGIPVRRITTTAGGQTVIEITEASAETFTDATFAVPDGLQKQDMMAGMGRMGRGR